MPPRIEITGDAEKAAPFILWAKREWYLREGRWVKHTGTCLIELFRAGDTGLIRIIPETVVGFVGHPRTGSLKQLPFWNNDMDQKYLTGIDGGGYFEKNGAWEEIANRTPYPLEDSDFGTFLLEKEVEWLGDTDNYGNCWWTDGDSTLSWKANPNWQFSLDSSFNIPGLSRPENKVGDKQYFTCFSNNIYEAGEVLTVGPVTPPAFGSNVIEPSLIAGAWYLSGALLCCSVINKADTVGGYWLGIYKQDGEEWKLIGSEFTTSRLHTPAFISKDGKTVVQGSKKYTINADLTEVIQTSLLTVENIGTRIITGAGGYGSTYKYTSSAEYWAGINKDNLPEISLVSSKADFGYSSVGNTSVQTKMVPVYRGNPATSLNLFAESVGGSIIFTAEPNGSYCSVQWSGVDSFDGLTATKIPEGICPYGYTVTCTLQPQGVSATYTYDPPETAMSISGPTGSAEAPISGGTYSASNAIGTVTWSTSCGIIDQSGVAHFNGCFCIDPGVVVVTATDECGRTASINVTVVTSGSWQSIWWGGCASVCNDYGMPAIVYITTGNIRKMYYIYWGVTNTPESTPCNSPEIITFGDPPITTGRWYGPSFYGGCGAGVYGSYICYSATHCGTEQLVCN